LRKLFSGDMDFRKTETNLFLDFVRAEEGSGEESARASVFEISEWGYYIKKSPTELIINIVPIHIRAVILSLYLKRLKRYAAGIVNIPSMANVVTGSL